MDYCHRLYVAASVHVCAGGGGWSGSIFGYHRGNDFVSLNQAKPISPLLSHTRLLCRDRTLYEGRGDSCVITTGKFVN